MREPDRAPASKQRYEPPTVTRVYVDPQQELLQTSVCSFQLGTCKPDNTAFQ